MKELLLVKWGGSIITNKGKEYTPRRYVIGRLARELMTADLTNKQVIIVHGSGSFAHRPAAKYKTAEGIIDENSINGFPLVADAAAQINRIVVKECIKQGLKSVSVSPFSITLADNKKAKQIFMLPIIQMLKIGLIPTLYGDVIMDDSRGFCIFSAEKSISTLASRLKGEYDKIKIVFCGDTDGVYDDKKETVEVITQGNFDKIRRIVGGSGSVDVTGGMLHKIEEGLDMAKTLKAEILIINGNRPDEFRKAVSGEKVRGTTIKG